MFLRSVYIPMKVFSNIEHLTVFILLIETGFKCNYLPFVNLATTPRESKQKTRDTNDYSKVLHFENVFFVQMKIC